MSATFRASRALGAYTCAACRVQTTSFSTSTTRRAVLDTEKWRKKIWGTEKPPGAKDPYGGPSAAEIYAAERKGQPIKQPKPKAPRAPKASNIDMSTYLEADSWEGLEEVGGKGIWWMNREEPEFNGYMPAMIVEDPYEVTAALHRAVVEVFALRAASEPLSLLGVAAIGPDVTSEVQIISNEDGGRLALPEHIRLEDITKTFGDVVDETTVKTNPTTAEAEVAADRSVPPRATREEVVDEIAAKVAPTESEANVAADRSTVDPLKDAAYKAMVESWDPTWLSISLRDPALKFAVSSSHTFLPRLRVS